MKNLQMYCISMEPSHYNFIKELGYIPVGLGENKFSNDWMQDNTGKNISNKNKNYGEYTFHYWIWKNYIDNQNFKDGWIGFCQYRKFWTIKNNPQLANSLDHLKSLTLKEIPTSYQDVDVVLGEEIVTTNFKKMKFLKKGLKLFFKNPSYLFNRNNRNIKFLK